MTGRYQQRFGHEFNPGPDAAGATALRPPARGDDDRRPAEGRGLCHRLVRQIASGLSSREFHPLKRGFDEFFGFLGGAHATSTPRRTRAIPSCAAPKPVDEHRLHHRRLRPRGRVFIEKHQHAAVVLSIWPFNAVHAPAGVDGEIPGALRGHRRPKRRTFAAMLSAMDDAVGPVLAKIRELATGREHADLLLQRQRRTDARKPPRATARCAASRRRPGKAASACRSWCSGKAVCRRAKWTTGR